MTMPGFTADVALEEAAEKRTSRYSARSNYRGAGPNSAVVPQVPHYAGTACGGKTLYALYEDTQGGKTIIEYIPIGSCEVLSS